MTSARHPGDRQGWIWLPLLRMCRRACFLPRFCCYRSSWLTISSRLNPPGCVGSGGSRRRENSLGSPGCGTAPLDGVMRDGGPPCSSGATATLQDPSLRGQFSLGY